MGIFLLAFLWFLWASLILLVPRQASSCGNGGGRSALGPSRWKEICIATGETSLPSAKPKTPGLTGQEKMGVLVLKECLLLAGPSTHIPFSLGPMQSVQVQESPFPFLGGLASS